MDQYDHIVKTPTELKTLAIDFTDQLGTGVTISSGTVAAVDMESGATTSGTVLGSTTATISGNEARAVIRAGTNGTDHRITFTVTLSDSSVLQYTVVMEVRA